MRIPTYSYLDIESLWERRGVPLTGIVIVDAEYAVPTKKWLLRVARIHAEQSQPYSPAYDCDDFAMSLKLRTQQIHAQVMPTVDGLAVGVLFYVDDEAGPHAINWALHRRGLYFVEPQTGREKCLSKSELRSVYFVYV